VHQWTLGFQEFQLVRGYQQYLWHQLNLVAQLVQTVQCFLPVLYIPVDQVDHLLHFVQESQMILLDQLVLGHLALPVVH